MPKRIALVYCGDHDVKGMDPRLTILFHLHARLFLKPPQLQWVDGLVIYRYLLKPVVLIFLKDLLDLMKDIMHSNYQYPKIILNLK